MHLEQICDDNCQGRVAKIVCKINQSHGYNVKYVFDMFCYVYVGADSCRSRTTCHECIGVAKCAWCSQEVFVC